MDAHIILIVYTKFTTVQQNARIKIWTYNIGSWMQVVLSIRNSTSSSSSSSSLYVLYLHYE